MKLQMTATPESPEEIALADQFNALLKDGEFLEMELIGRHEDEKPVWRFIPTMRLAYNVCVPQACDALGKNFPIKDEYPCDEKRPPF